MEVHYSFWKVGSTLYQTSPRHTPKIPRCSIQFSQSHVYEMYVLIHTCTGLALLNIIETRPEGHFGGRTNTENSYVTINAEESRRRTDRIGHLVACWESCRIGWSSMGTGPAGQWTSSRPLIVKNITLAHTLTGGTTCIYVIYSFLGNSPASEF